jgi:hypothetical protein
MRTLRGLIAALRAPLGHLYDLVVNALQLHVRRLRHRSVRNELEQLRSEVRRLGSASVESLTYVAAELRTLAAQLETERPEIDTVEALFAHRCLAAVKPPARILAVGAGPSSFTGSLEALGYDVTAVASADIPAEGERFDAVVWRSSLEQDDVALDRISELLAPDGLLVLTVPLRSSNGELGTDEPSVTQRLEGWDIVERTFVERQNGGSASATGAGRPVVALFAASPRRPE